MELDHDLLHEAIGSAPAAAEPLRAGGYTRSGTWRIATPEGLVFVKQAEDEGSLEMLRREAVVYRGVRGPFLPALVAFADSGDRALLALEYVEGAHWPPPYPADVRPLFDSLELLGVADSPPGVPVQRPPVSRWEQVAADPTRFLELELCSQGWLERSLPVLAQAEAGADFTGDALVHNDVYSGNVGFTRRGAVLVDWGAAVRGSRWVDVAFALLSVRVEGGTPPAVVLPGEGAFAAALAGHFAVEAPAPLPSWAEVGSTLREDMARDLAHALVWCVEALELEPLR